VSESEIRERIIAVIAEHVAEHGYPPSVRDIGLQVGLSSPSTVQSHLEQLRKAGRLTSVPGKPRTLRVVS